MEQDGNIESPEINSCTYGHLKKGGKNIQWRKDNLFKTSGAGQTGQPLVKG